MSLTLEPVLSPEPMERRVLLADVLDVAIGDSGARSVSFVDADGTAAAVSVRGAAAVVRFTGEGLAQAPTGQGVAVTGTGVSVATVTATGTSRRTALLFTASGVDGRVAVGQIMADGPMKCITGPQVVLTGPLSSGGPVGRIDLLRAENATITVGPGAGQASIRVSEAAVDSSIVSAVSVRRIELGSWGGVDPGDSITVPSARVISAGSFTGDIIAGSAGTLALAEMLGTTVQLNGSLGRLHGTRAVGSRVSVTGDIKSIAFDYMRDSQVYAGVGALPVGSQMPTSPTDFANDSTIGRFALTHPDNSGGVVVAARQVARLDLKSVYVGQVTDIFIVADRIGGGTAFAYTITFRPKSRVRLPRLEQDVFELGSVRLQAL